MEPRSLGKRWWRFRVCRIKQIPASGMTSQSLSCLDSRFRKFGTHVILFVSTPSLQSNLLLRDFAEFPHSECADLIDPGKKVADGIVNPSASRLLLRIHIRTEPVWYGSSVSFIRGSCLSPPHPQPPPYLGPSYALWANLGRVCLLYLRRTDSGVCGGARCNRRICWNCPTRTKIGAAGMESSVFCMRISGFQSVSGLSLDKQDVPHLLHIFKSAIFMFLGAWRPLRTQHRTILLLL